MLGEAPAPGTLTSELRIKHLEIDVIIDVHAHYTSAPPQLDAYRGRQMSELNRPRPGNLKISEPARPSNGVEGAWFSRRRRHIGRGAHGRHNTLRGALVNGRVASASR